ncbi:class I SAM-dependent methyltransferase [Ramlibacter sp. AW1]|uniref:Class I SAM-dependent methyltransferase n=1 Tax=Ramlibacter aurantiacus TaxID=2801330 RepID=A0A936ZGU3_9BURK|nr:methyltransferase domain-containing protein [Ramlibacter aurantiacus]MBL0419597.1 class I SAM-dependent methyltransferase [Ramlibacter aurantiacus]
MVGERLSPGRLYAYSDDFYAYQQRGSLRSANAIVPMLAVHLRPSSVLDVGCGAGAWCRSWIDHGVADTVGVDGSYVDRSKLLMDCRRFVARDVGADFHLGRTFDLAQCLEVAEHLKPAASETLVGNLVAHAPIVLFSAARPGQGGENHVNERPYAYWRDRFGERGYLLYDFVRPQLAGRRFVEPWYRFNTLLFVRQDLASRLPPSITRTRIDDRSPVPDRSPLPYRLRCAAMSLLAPDTVTRLAKAKHRLLLRSRALSSRQG